MSPLRLLVLTAAFAGVAAPLVAVSAPGGESTRACTAQPTALVERRISEEAAKGLPALIQFVNRSRPIYQLQVVDAVAWIDADRERRTACLSASAAAVAN